jgi:hypothetical protein
VQCDTVDQFLGGRVFGRFVVAPAPGEARELHRQPNVALDLSPPGGSAAQAGQVAQLVGDFDPASGASAY